MLTSSPINITFRIPAQDHLGREAVVGKVRFLAENVELHWRLEGNVFRGGKGDLATIELPYSEIEEVELQKKWFRYRTLILRLGDPALVKEIPGVTMGKLVLDIEKRSLDEVKRLVPLIDFKRSVFRLEEAEKRISGASD